MIQVLLCDDSGLSVVVSVIVYSVSCGSDSCIDSFVFS